MVGGYANGTNIDVDVLVGVPTTGAGGAFIKFVSVHISVVVVVVEFAPAAPV